MARKRVAILISGRGSNMAALIKATLAGDYPAEIAIVLSDTPGVAGIGRAQAAKIRTGVVDRAAYPDKAAFEAALQAEIEAAEADLICLAGFMRILSADFVSRWPDRIINIHPSILPSFRGIDTHQRAIEAGVKLHGCTVHFVRAEVDAGPIIAQAAIPVLPEDTAESLADRLLMAEHQLYPQALGWVASGRARIEDGRVVVDGVADQRENAMMVPTEADGSR